MSENLTASTPAPQDRLLSIQLLRALAATMVVALHAAYLLSTPGITPQLGVGVDLFFVISGFVIVFSSRSLFQKPNGWRRFLALRLARVVPLYWMALTLRLALLAIGSFAGAKGFPTTTEIFTSYFFIPYDSMHFGDKYPFPILDLGWSLNYEMFFYLVFAAFLMLSMQKAVLLAGSTLAAGVVVGHVLQLGLPLSFWLQPIILEFVAGMLTAILYARGMRINPIISLLILGLGLYLWFGVNTSAFRSDFGPGYYDFSRFVFLGGGAIAFVVAATLTANLILPPILARLSVLGNSSYALYLIHPFILLGVKGCLHFVSSEITSTKYVLFFVVLICIFAAHIVHIVVERPVNAWLRGLIDLRKNTTIIVPPSGT